MLKKIAAFLVRRAERRIGVKLDYVHKIAQTRVSLAARYDRFFSFLDQNKIVPPVAYHTARIRGAVAADCGTCVEAEINLAKNAKIAGETIERVLSADYSALPADLAAVARLTDAVVARREDDPEARAAVVAAYDDAGLIELSYAMNGAALLPGVKRAMGYAVACDLAVLRKVATR